MPVSPAFHAYGAAEGANGPQIFSQQFTWPASQTRGGMAITGSASQIFTEIGTAYCGDLTVLKRTSDATKALNAGNFQVNNTAIQALDSTWFSQGCYLKNADATNPIFIGFRSGIVATDIDVDILQPGERVWMRIKDIQQLWFVSAQASGGPHLYFSGT